MQPSEWQNGDNVLVRGRPWIIGDVESWPECVLLRLAPADRRSGGPRSILSPFDRPVRLDRPRRARVLRTRGWLHAIRSVHAGLVPFGGSIAAGRASVRLLPYQLEPLLAALRYGATRLLVADEVGLGKTVQAGWILLELSARAESFRGVVLVPAGLREQWASELGQHFGLDTVQADAQWLQSSARSRPADVNPWALPGIYIVSVDFAKRPEVLRSLEDVGWDLAILDEAHLASASSDRRAAAHAVASRSTRTVSLTATPEAGDPAAFRALCEIGRVSATEPPVLFFRRTRAGVSDAPRRRSRLLRVQPSAAEQRMHDLLNRYTAAVWREAGFRHDNPARLATIVLRKRALSSAGSLAVSVQRRLELLAGSAIPSERQLLLPLADEEPSEDDIGDRALSAPGLADARRERRWLGAVVEAARNAARAESKARYLLRWLARVPEPVIIFTEYRDTLHRLERLIKRTGRPVATLHGGLDRRERARVQAAFNAGGLSLLATDAAAEGLNLHHHCRIVLHYELPWRPSRIEQRAGRVDRLGQTRRVHEIALLASGTAERLVLAPLAARAARAREAGDPVTLLDALTESDVADLILGGRDASALSPPQIDRAHVRTVDLRDEACREAARLECSRHGSATRQKEITCFQPGVAVSAIRSIGSTTKPGICLVFVVFVTDGWKRRVHAESCVIFAEMRQGHSFDRSASSMRRLAGAAEEIGRRPGAGIRERLERLQEAVLDRVAGAYRAAAEHVRAREDALQHVQTSAARQLVQAGLFERRALRAASRGEVARDTRLYELSWRQDIASPAEDLVCGVELSAMLVVSRGGK